MDWINLAENKDRQMWGNSWVAEQMVASQKGFGSTEFYDMYKISYLVPTR
jgi:hypothetical protein